MAGILYQHGTLATLVPGLFAGTQTVGELLQHGDTGIGTLTGLDGELIILNGEVTQVAASGQLRQVGPTEQVPFANVHFAAFTPAGTLRQLDFAGAKAALRDAMGTANLFVGFKLHGSFTAMTTRAVHGQQPPYPTLTATAGLQQVFTAEQVTGTVVGYFSPTLYAGLASPGFHLHFLSDAHDMGGHILSFAVAEASLAVQEFADIQLHLPSDNAAFRNEKFDESQIVADIVKAEN